MTQRTRLAALLGMQGLLGLSRSPITGPVLDAIRSGERTIAITDADGDQLVMPIFAGVPELPPAIHSRTNCAKCGGEIPPGKPGRCCKTCRG